MIARVDSSHLGPDTCVRRARVFKTVKFSMTLIPHGQRLVRIKGQDLFTYGNETFLVTVDYYSDSVEVDLLKDTYIHTYIHTLLARPHGAFQSQFYITKL